MKIQKLLQYLYLEMEGEVTVPQEIESLIDKRINIEIERKINFEIAKNEFKKLRETIQNLEDDTSHYDDYMKKVFEGVKVWTM